MEVIKEIRVGGSHTRYVDRNVTVIQPMFLDRNITSVVEEIVLTPGEDTKTIVYEEEEISLLMWAIIILAILVLGYLLKILFTKKPIVVQDSGFTTELNTQEAN